MFVNISKLSLKSLKLRATRALGILVRFTTSSFFLLTLTLMGCLQIEGSGSRFGCTFEDR
ncbi:hypothetical protein BpHYR1_022245 [Brachionus plicatilis]|uniref:Uncharacterized protein n=1 Tax=Brachionus plicatilis TaxID=10195 RepID=A0A3M7T589_BRAPC|nr:hypothetical protein BpHYR1_022245 [Brachionus plicatilis]